jgi:uncharacterized protein YjbJ (UPF0337 family)
MNKDQIKGTTKEVAGKIQEKTGKLIDSKEQRQKGLKKQIDGKIERAQGDFKEIVKEVVERG